MILFTALGVGVLYGTTSVAVGHPLDTVKTKMQAQSGYESSSMIRTFSKTLKSQGIRGLYRGALPPLMGSGIFRSTQFAGDYQFSSSFIRSFIHSFIHSIYVFICQYLRHAILQWTRRI